MDVPVKPFRMFNPSQKKKVTNEYQNGTHYGGFFEIGGTPSHHPFHFRIFPHKNHPAIGGFPMLFLWFSYGFPMVFQFSYGFPMVFLWFSSFPMVFLWFGVPNHDCGNAPGGG